MALLSFAWKDWERKASNFPPEVAFQLYSFRCRVSVSPITNCLPEVNASHVKLHLSLSRRIRYILFIFLYFRLKLCKNIKKPTALRTAVFWGICDDGILQNVWIYDKNFKYTVSAVRTHDQQWASTRYISTLKTSLYLVCFLLFSHGVLPKFRENYGDSLSVI